MIRLRKANLRQSAAKAAGMGACTFGMLLSASMSAAQPDHGNIKIPARLQISAPPAGTLYEFSTQRIPFQLTLNNGIGGPATIDLVVCNASFTIGGCRDFGRVTTPWRSPSGSSLTIKLPKAAPLVDVGLVACIKVVNTDGLVTCGRQLATNTVTRPIAARYIVAIDSFTIRETRSQLSDTVHVGLMGTIRRGSAPSLDSCNNAVTIIDQAHPIGCRGPFRIGSGKFREGTYALGNTKIGEFSSVPGSNTRLRFAYVVFNFGFPVQAPGVADNMRGRSRGAMREQLLTLNQLPSADFTGDLNSSPWLGCDGPTAGAGVQLLDDGSGRSLDALTNGNGRYQESSSLFRVPSQAGCGPSSRYLVTWSLRRVGWPG